MVLVMAKWPNVWERKLQMTINLNRKLTAMRKITIANAHLKCNLFPLVVLEKPNRPYNTEL